MITRKTLTVLSCLLALTGLACAQPQGNNQQSNNQQKNSNTEENKAGTFNIGIGVPSVQAKATDHGAAQTKIYEPDCGKPKDQPEADLCTQRRVANAAEEALQYNLAQTLIGAFGVAFVVVTLGLTARANKAAKIAAQAAVDAVGSERAWLSFKNIGIYPSNNSIIDGDIRNESIVFNVAWINTGRSPSIKTNIAIRYQVLLMDDPLPSVNFEEPPAFGIIGPGITNYSNDKAIYGDDLILFKQRKKKIIIWSRATYETIYHQGIRRHTDMCAQLIWNGTRVRGAAEELNIDIKLKGEFNSAS